LPPSKASQPSDGQRAAAIADSRVAPKRRLPKGGLKGLVPEGRLALGIEEHGLECGIIGVQALERPPVRTGLQIQADREPDASRALDR